MGRLVTTVVGGAIGFYIGGPVGAQIGMTLGGMIGASLFGPTIKGPRLNDLKVSASTYGTAIPEVYGTTRVGGNMIWTTGIIETTKKSNGKGGPKQETYSYDATFAIALCKGIIDDVLRIWADGKLIYDKTAGSTRKPFDPTFDNIVFEVFYAFTGQNQKRSKRNIRVRIYTGTEDQLPDSFIVADKGAENVSAHRGIAYAVFERMPLENYGNRIPQFTFEVTKKRVNAFPTLIAKSSGGNPISMQSSYEIVPLWDFNRVIIAGNEQTLNLNFSTMGLIGGSDNTFVFDFRKRYIPELGTVLTTRNLFNSSPIKTYSLSSFAELKSWGVQTNDSTFGFVNLETEEYALGNLGPIGFCRNAKKTHYITTNFAGATWGLDDGKYPFFVDDETPFQPAFYFEGQSGLSQSDIIGYRGANDRVELIFWNISSDAKYKIVDELVNTPSGPVVEPVWKSSDEWSRTQTNLQPFGGERYSTRMCLYDPSDDSIFSLGFAEGVPAGFKWQRSTGQYLWKKKYPGVNLPPFPMHYSRLNGGTFAWITSAFAGVSAKITEISLQSGEIARNISVGEIFGNSTYIADTQQQWDDVTKTIIVGTNGIYRRFSLLDGVQSFSVRDVIEDVCLKTGLLTIDDIDTSAITNDAIVGYVIDRETSGRDVLRQLATGFLFDGYESDFKLKFKSRGSLPVVTIPEDWITRDNEGLTVRQTLTQELELPMRVSVNFYDITRDHQQGSQTQKRKSGPVPTMWTNKEDLIDLPITWTPDQGKQCADKLLKMMWANRESYKFELPWRYLRYDPTDVAAVTLEDGSLFTIRFTEANIGADFNVSIDGVSEKAAAYTSQAKGATSYAPLQLIGETYPSYPVLVNTPLLRDMDYRTDGNSICYISAGTNATSFSGAAIFIDDGYEYVPLTVIDKQSVTGNALTVLSPTKTYESTDEETRLVISLDDTTNLLESITQEAMLSSDRNAALIGEEVIQFRDAEQQADGTWVLSGILRARRGTNYAVNNHVANEPFVIIEPSSVGSFIRPPSEYTVLRNFKAVPLGDLVEDSQPYQFQIIPRDLMPYTPEDIKLQEDAGTVTITMSRRSRVTAPLVDLTDIIPYTEGETVSARIEYKLWADKGLADIQTFEAPTRTGTIPLFNSSGIDIPAEMSFPLSVLEGETRFLLRLAEIGVVEGTPKWIAFERLGENRWNAADLY